MAVRRIGVLALAWLLAATALAATVYQARNRPAEDLALLVRPVLGEGGVAVDARANALILSGSAAAVREAEKILRGADVAARSVRISIRFVDPLELERRGVRIAWSRADGGFRVGTPAGELAPGIAAHVRPGSRHYSTHAREDASLVVQEGSEGFVATAEAVPVSQWLLGYGERQGAGAVLTQAMTVTTGLAVRPRIVDGGRVLLSITPKATATTRNGLGEIVAREAETTVSVADGGQIVLVESGTEAGRVAARFLSGLAEEGGTPDRAMLCRVEILR